MNNIYKVIWSKAKNCYVVASEIAKSHTKSASGSEKMGGYGKKALLALAAASAIFCGGLVNVGATVHVNDATGVANEVYTMTEVNTELEKKADKTAVEKIEKTVGGVDSGLVKKTNDNATGIEVNKTNIKTLQDTVGDDTKGLTKKINDNATAINTLTTTVSGKADTTAVTALGERVGGVEGKVTTLENTVGNDSRGLVKDVNDLRTQGTTLNNALGSKADKNDLEAATNRITANEGNITDLQKKTTGLSDDGKSLNDMQSVETGALKVTGGITNGLGVTTTLTDINQSMEQTKKNTTDIDALKNTTTEQQTTIDSLKEATTRISYDKANDTTSINGMKVGQRVDMGGKDLTRVGAINGTKIGTKVDGTYIHQGSSIWENMKNVDTQVGINTTAIAALDTKVGTVNNGTYLDSSKSVGENLNKLNDGLVQEVTDRKAADDTLSGRIDANANTIAKVNQELVNTNNHFNTELRNTNAALQEEGKARAEADAKINTKIGNIDDTRTVYVKDANSISQNLTTLDEKLQNTNDRTGGITRNTEDTQTTIEGSVKVDNQGNVKDVKDLSAETITTKGDAAIGGKLNVTGASDLKGDVTLGTPNGTNTVTVNGTANFQETVKMNNGLNVTNGETNLKKTTVDGDLKVTGTITTDKMVFGDKTTNNYTEIDKGHITSKNDVLAGDATKKSSSMELDHSKLEVGVADKDSNGHLTMTADQTSIKNSDLDEKNYSEIVADKDSVTTTVKDEKGNTTSTKSSATEIRNYAKDKDGNKTINAQSATQNKSWAKDKDGNESSIVQTGKDITNTAEKGTITSKAKDIVNDASGNISNKSQTMDTTVTGKATESYGSLDTTVKGNETHIVKGTKTETVDGKVTENYKAGQETNVTGDQDIKVSGTQTTTATDINRNASSGMIDTVENAFGSNTETKVAGQTTTDVKLASGEEGHYIRGATESRDYLLNGALKNSETKTAEATSSEITDGTNTASTRQDAKNLAGSVTNGTETGISGIHANADGSVSIDSAVAGGGMSSVINQKKDSIQSAVGDGTNSTVIHQDKDNVTIASSNGMVGLVGKDIVNNAQDTITNTAGTSITNQVNDSKVTTDANGTTFENNTPAVSDGGATTTKINGNQITTGRVDANELGVSDKDGTNTADLSVKAGEGVKASASDGTTTGSLDVTADEVGSTVKDASGKGSTFKQRIDAIMMESKDVSITAEETLTNEAKVITNKASEVINNEAININNTATGIITSKASEIKNQADKLISNKVGENTWENMEDGKITTSIKNGTKQNLTQSDAEKTEHSVVNGSNSTVNKQTSEEITDAVTNGTTTNVTQNTATSSNNTIADKNGNANTVISTADGTSFINSKAAAPVTGASGAGTHLNTTIKGNTITTGQVTMDYADVMKDLGVRGNANITGKTTTGSLEVTGTTTTKTLKVTENAEIDGTLKVAKKATFDDSVSIAKDLSVGGDVTANSYKVGDKTYISAAGINANDQKITNVADGSISEGSKDAVNGGQLYTVKNDLEGKVNKVGANAAAMANLHPMEFDPDSKWNIAAAIGNYGSETAAALGAFYRPNDDVMVNLSTAFGTGENMVGGGVSVRLGKGGNKLSREESNALKDQVNDLTARMDALLSVLNPNMSKDFPDVPENHWAYEAVSRLAGNDIVQGYPDGEFHGERTMTRYEMAEIIYNALSRGAEAEKELVEEFKPELQAMAASEKATAERAEG